SRRTNILVGDLQGAGQVTGELFGRQSRLFDPEKQEFASPFGRICRNLLNQKIFGQPLARPANSRQARRDQEKGGLADKVIWHQVGREVLHSRSITSARRASEGERPP